MMRKGEGVLRGPSEPETIAETPSAVLKYCAMYGKACALYMAIKKSPDALHLLVPVLVKSVRRLFELPSIYACGIDPKSRWIS